MKRTSRLHLVQAPSSGAPQAPPAAPAPLPSLVATAIEALRAIVRAEIASALDEQRRQLGAKPLDLVDGDASPLGKRKHNEACRRGLIPGARKLHRRWLAPRGAVLAFIEAEGKAPAAAAPAPASPVAVDQGEATLEQLRGDMGLQRHHARRGR